MSYLALARKYRPRTFAQMVGQQHILRALTNALEQQRLHHAYLFTGTRGVGKTTVARILAKCLNCETGITSTPCDTCQSCQEINTGRFIDLIEVDAASRTKVEDTRELLENVQYLPQRGRYKIYLIDEVHMLSTNSFNALLKTLEEPPAHVIFLLATTDPERLPPTILSRCLQFHLKNLPSDMIATYLKEVSEKETIAFEPAGLAQIADAAQGSMRDALSLLDQAIAFSANHVTEKAMLEMLGSISQIKLIELLTLLAKQDKTRLMQVIDELNELGADFLHVLDQLLSWLQIIAVAQLLQQGDDTTLSLAKQFTPEDIQLYYQIGLLGKRDLPLAPDAKNGFVMTIIRMLAFTPQQTTSPIKTKTRDDHQPVVAQSVKVDVKTNNSVTEWSSIVSKLNLTGATQLLATNCSLDKMTDTQIELVLDQSHEALLNPMAQDRLSKAIEEKLSKKYLLKIRIDKPLQETPAGQQIRQRQEKQQSVTQQLQQDAKLNTLLETFNATIQPESISIIEEK